jgi:hypothetical protein
MASIIRIKRSTTAGNPATLAAGELAYSGLTDNDSNGGDRLYLGLGTETNGNAASHLVIGGKYFTDLLDHTRGTLTASSALITDSNSKLDNLKVDNLDLNGNTISSTDANGNIVLDPNGTGYVSITGTNGLIIPVGTNNQRAPSVQGAIRYNTDTSSFEGYTGSTWGSLGGVKSVDGLTYISAESSPGSSNDTLSFVTDNVERMSLDTDSLDIANSILTTNINSTLTSTSTTTGALVVDGGVGIAENLNVGGVINIDNLRLDTNTLSSTNSNGNIILAPNGTGDIQLDSDTVRIGDSNANATITTNGTGDLILNTNSGTTTGSITIEDGVNGNITLAPDGTGKLVLNNPYINGTTDTLAEFIYDTVGGAVTSGTGITVTNSDVGNTSTVNITNTTVTAGSYGSTTAIPTFTVNAQGQLTAAGTENISTTLNIAGDTGTDAIAHLTDTLTFTGGEGIDTTVTNNVLTIAAEDASTSNKGVASFNTDDFNVTSGAVELKDTVVKSITTDSGALTPSTHGISILGGEGMDVSHASSTITIAGEDATTTNKGIASFATANFDVTSGAVSTKTITLGTSTLTNGSTTNSLAGLQQLDVDNLQFNGNSIISTDTNGGITLDPNGTGHVSVSNALIKDVATPVDPTDAANKAYVDAVAEGLHIHASVQAATTAVITGSVTYDNGTSGVGATLTTDTPINTLDGYSLVNGDRVLIKNQANTAHNGIYIRTSSTVFTRAADFNTVAEIASGDFLFVSNGTVNGKTGWVNTTKSIAVGTTAVVFEQFSGAGTYIAGSGLAFTGNTIDIVLQTSGGLEIVSDELGLKSTTAGSGLTFSSGVLNIGGTADRITVNNDSIDIASTYAGQNTITTLGTIASGTWQGTTIGTIYGGTGNTSYSIGDLLVGAAANALNKLSIGTTGKVLQSNGTTLVYGDVDGGTYA